jgi:type 1 glutamine amidotransferase/HEAT repeat protein
MEPGDIPMNAKTRMNRQKSVTWTAAVIAALSLFALTLSSAPDSQASSPLLKALIVTGQNSHDWRTSSAALKQMLEDTGFFRVDIAVSPPAGGNMKTFRPSFRDYRLAVLDYSGDPWPRPTQKSFVDFVKNGGGVVVFHSADNAFPDWPEYNEIIGLGGWGNRDEKAGPYVFFKDGRLIRDTRLGIAGYHTPPHAFLVATRDPDHPVTAGLPSQWMHAEDELYGLLRGPATNIDVLATAYSSPEESGTGRDEPVLFTVTYGAGRVFHTVLGHAGPGGAPPSLECVGFIVTFQRGAEWAATGRVTQKVPPDFPATDLAGPTPADVRRWPGFRPPSLDAILTELGSLEYSRNEDVLYRLREYVLNHRNVEESRAACEENLLAFLTSPANAAAKLAACRELRLIGTEKSVPILREMLLEDETTDMARFALEKIPGAAATRAMLDALETCRGEAKLGLISSLGQRKTQDAVRPLGALLSDSDLPIASAAAVSLGRIGGYQAAAILAAEFDRAAGDRKPDIAFALLRCADELASAKDPAAAKFYDAILTAQAQPPLPLVLRQAAMKGKIASAGKDEGARLILDLLARGPQEMHEPAIALVPKFFDDSSIASICSLLPRLPEPSQVQILARLPEYSGASVLPAVLEAAKNPASSLRIVALKALAKCGDASTVPLLAGRAASSRGEEQEAARASLSALPGWNVDEAILFGLLSTPDNAVRSEFIRAVGERRVHSGRGILMGLLRSPAPKISLEAAKALRTIASPGDIPVLLNILLNVGDETTQEEVQNTVAALAKKISAPYARAAAVEERLKPGEDSKLEKVTDIPKRCLLYRVLGKIGDDSSLPLVRAARREDNSAIRDAAVRALAEWPSTAPRDDLLAIAGDAESLVHQVLALRGYVRMVRLEKYQSPEGAVSSLEAALALTTRPEEKILILGALPDFACPEALRLAESLLGTKDIEAEAEVAVARIKEILDKN